MSDAEKAMMEVVAKRGYTSVFEFLCPACKSKLTCCCDKNLTKLGCKEAHGRVAMEPCLKAVCEECGWSGVAPHDTIDYEQKNDGEFKTIELVGDVWMGGEMLQCIEFKKRLAKLMAEYGVNGVSLHWKRF